MDFTKPHGIGEGLQSSSPEKSIHKGVVDLIRTIVPRAKQLPDFKPGDDFEKALRVNIREACKTLKTRLRNIVEKGDAGGFVLLRRQLHDFREVYSHQLKSLNPADIRPLDILQESIDTCDKNSLLENGVNFLAGTLSETEYRSGSHGPWSALEMVLIDTAQLAKEAEKGDIMGPLFDKYYTKYLDGVIAVLARREKQSFEMEVLEMRDTWSYRNIQSTPEKSEAEVFSELREKFQGKTTAECLDQCIKKMSQYTDSRSVRKCRFIYEHRKGSINHLLNELKKLRSDSQYQDFLKYTLIDVLENLDSIRPVVLEMAQARHLISHPEDTAFISQMEDIMMSLYRDIMVYIRPLTNDGPLLGIIRQRLLTWGEDIKVCSGNKERFPIWSVWFKDLTLGQRQ